MSSALTLPQGAFTRETLELAKAALGGLLGGLSSFDSPDSLRKAGLNLAENLAGVNLEAPAKMLVPVYSPLRNTIARVKAAIGAKKVDWHAVRDLDANKVWSNVAEGARNAFDTITTEDRSATFKTLEKEGYVTIEALQASRAYDDLLAKGTLMTLWSHMIREEFMILGGNITVIGKPSGTPATSSAAAVAPAVAFGAGTYKFKISALVLQGADQGAKGQVAAVDSVGETDASTASADQIVAGGEDPTVTWNDVKGAVAYNVYAKIAADPTFTYQATVFVNKWTAQVAYVNTGNVPNAADQTGIATQFDGIIPDIEKNVTGDQYQSLDGGTLTAEDGGAIAQFEKALLSQWDNFRLGATEIWCHSQQFRDIRKKIVGTSNPAMRIMLQDGERNLIGGVAVTGYLNNYSSPTAEGVPPIIPIKVHPFIPKGTILFTTMRVPYPLNEVPNVYEIEENEGYTQRNFAFTTRRFEWGIESIQVLKSYFPVAHAVIKNVGPG